jgi:CBS domain containing-hemolysin-like protein
MSALLALLISGGMTLLLQTLAQTYFYLHPKELNRRAENGKQTFKNIQRVSRFGATAKVFLGALQFIFAAATVIIICRRFDPLWALVWLAGFAGLLSYAKSKKPGFATNLAARLAPALAKLLHYIEPLEHLVSHLTPAKRKSVKTDIYDKDDLKELIRRQRNAVNNRIEQSELESALRALDFESKKIKDTMVPRGKVHFVGHKEPIGPILISELHKTGFTCFPVKGNSKDEVLGMLDIHNLVEHAEGGAVTEAMDPHVLYVHEDQKLDSVLHAFAKTGACVFLVINSQEKIVGLVTLHDVLEQILGRSIDTSFEEYNDPRAVAGAEQGKSEE